MDYAGQNGLHWRAAKWYYDIVAQNGAGVPESILRHVWRCLVCRKQIDRLNEAVTGAGGETDTSRSKMKRDVIDTLSEHFRCLEERVTCSRVRPFLPGLLMPSVRIRIPTPITVHVDHCSECAEDLAALRDLALSVEQLERLERLYACELVDSPRLCRQARPHIAAFVRGCLGGIPSEILDHLCTCERCRGRVHRRRQELLENWADGETKAARCNDGISTAQLFDYAVPYGRAEHVAQPPPSAGEFGSPAETPNAEDRVWEPEAPGCEGTTPEGGGATGAAVPHDHVRTCRWCLKKIHELDETIYGIAERTNSGVVTVYRTLRETKAVPGSFPDPYPEYPIDVQVVQGEPEPVAAPAWSLTGVRTALQRSTCDPQVRLVLKAVLAVAALIPLVFLFRGTRTASGITLGQVVKAVRAADNVHITRLHPATGEVLQELRVARARNVVVVTTGPVRDVYDLGALRKESVNSNLDLLESVELSEEDAARVHEWVDRSLGFSSADGPPGATWRQIARDAGAGQAVYELTWTEQTRGGRDLFHKWEVTVDAATKRPQEIRVFWCPPDEDQWQLVSVQELRYLSQDQMAAEIRKSLERK